jgi:DNA segregation ATPase FtsK/SpoIIIE, S-DNA-T family
MSRLVVQRPARLRPPSVPAGELVVDAPPARQEEESGASAWLQYLLPAAGSLGSLLFVVTNPKPLFIAGGVLFALGTVVAGVAMHLTQQVGQRRRTEAGRRRYLDHLAEVRARARDTARRQHDAMRWRHPPPEALWNVATSRSRVWERRPGDDDFLRLRAGTGSRPLATPLSLAGSGEPVATTLAQRVVAAHREVGEQPLTVDLREARVVTVVGPREAARAVARALVCQAAAFHSPEDVRLALAAGGEAAPAWDWCKWLPHLRPGAPGDVDPPATVVAGAAGLEALAAVEMDAARRLSEGRGFLSLRGEQDHVARSRLIAVADGVAPSPATIEALRRAPDVGVTLVVLAAAREDEPPHVDARLLVDAAGSLTMEPDGGEPGRADRPGPRTCEALARRLAPMRPSPESSRRALADELGLLPLLGVGDVEEAPGDTWRPRPAHDLLRVPIGVDSGGDPLCLDLKEPALGGDGPHGIVVGATGSGKSELLRTLVTSLAITHPPDLLSFVLVDFKGGAAFAGLSELPHVAGVITNLADDLALVDRMREALFGEQRRRQELLRRAGHLASLREYHRRRGTVAPGAGLEALPYLLLIVDEFGELLTARPDFIDLFVAVGRLGRSLGIHLLLASQQLDEGRLRGLEGHLSYRIALRTFSAAESRTVIDTPDAYHLPRLPGSGYFKVGTNVYTRFRAALVSQPYAPAAEAPAERLGAFTAASAAGAAAAVAKAAEPGEGSPSVLEAVVDRLHDAAPRVHQVWLPPLEAATGLEPLLSAAGALAVPLGTLDRPADQRRDVLTADFSGPRGHLAVVGAPQTGKSTLLRTLIAAFALSHVPADVQFYCVDLGGGTLAALEGLPHVGGVGGRQDAERVRRTVRQVAALLDERERRFRTLGVDSARAMRALRESGTVPDEPLADVFLCVDNWPALRQEFEELEAPVHAIASRGLGHGVHLVLTASRWMDIRASLLDAIGGRLELRLNDPMDSAVDRRAAENVPAGVPGRGLTMDGLHFQAALPRVDGGVGTTDLPRAVEDLVGRVAGAWRGPAAPPVLVLPARVLFTDLPAPGAGGGRGVPVGIAEEGMAPAYLDLAGGDPHCLVFGDGESGKTTLLRAFLLGLTVRQPPARARVLLVDYRRTLLGTVPAAHLAGYAGGAAAAAEQVGELLRLLSGRLPPADLTVEELRGRSWWSGPEAFVVVDDYDLVAAGMENPLAPLAEHVAQARDVGLHVVLARRTGGASRALFEPLLMALRDLNTQGVLLNGDPQEGPLLGDHRPERLPPGRGLLVRRNQSVPVQVAWVPPAGELS